MPIGDVLAVRGTRRPDSWDSGTRRFHPCIASWYICSMTRATPPKPSMSDLLVDALRYGVSRDATSARQLANRLFRKPPDGISDLATFRENLGRVIVMDGGQGLSLR